MKRVFKGLIAATLLAATGMTVHGSSHREALAILNEPCADNTDTYAWVSNGSHDKLYLIMDFNPLHEPGQGNQGLRACNGYRYEFHIAKGTSLKDQVVYRVEFTNKLTPEAPPSPTDPLGGGNELLWQLTGGTETMKVTRIVRTTITTATAMAATRTTTTMTMMPSSLAGISPSFPNNHGPQTDRLVYGLGPFPGLRLRAIPRAAKWASTISRSSTPSSTRSRTAGGSSPASSTIPISSTRRASSTWST